VFSILGDEGMGKPKLDYAMKVHMQRIVLIEKRPFSYLDFLDFEVDGKRYKMTHGTFRNKISTFIKNGLIQLEYYSVQAFYSLKGVHFAKPKLAVTDNHTVVSPLSSVSSVSFIDNLPADKHALHDIRFRFKVDNIWTVISINHPELKPNEVSKDISLDPLLTHDLTIKTTIHHTDTVSVIVACSLIPVAADLKGLVRLSNALTRIEERLLRYIECVPPSLSLSPIPEHDSWTVTMWHFGFDSPSEYTGEEFEVAWEDGEDELMRLYTKDMSGVTRIRRERQEYPNKRFDEAISENYPLSSRCARQLLKMPRQLVNREEQGKLIAQTNGAITMINESNYTVRSKSGYNNYNVFVTHSGWACSCPNYLCRDLKCKHVYAVEFYRRQSASI
jgi:hypothetical protein